MMIIEMAIHRFYLYNSLIRVRSVEKVNKIALKKVINCITTRRHIAVGLTRITAGLNRLIQKMVVKPEVALIACRVSSLELTLLVCIKNTLTGWVKKKNLKRPFSHGICYVISFKMTTWENSML